MKTVSEVVVLFDRSQTAETRPTLVDLPPESPLAMPRQSFKDPGTVDGPLTPASGAERAWRRHLIFAGALILAAGAAWKPFSMFMPKGFTPLEITGLVLFFTLSWCLGCWFLTAFAGFVQLWRERQDELAVDGGDLPELSTRTAILMPIYNEDFRAVAARLHAMDRSIAELGLSRWFDVFVLSDTTDEAVAAEERTGFTTLKASTVSTFYYRRREANTERKAGNLAEWVQRFGAAYPQMIVLDADSLMSGGLMARLVAAMERRSDIGLIQTVPSIVNGNTLFSRWAQFGVRLYGRVSATGLAWWSGAESSYWGHNAVIRTRAFAAHASLPCLPGKKPFGGHLMSHDVPEATLIRRGGWGVHVAPVSEGSYEESPPSLVEAAVRDRRWCQGNLQHAQILNGKGLHWVSRSHLMMGLMAYAMSPLWLVFLGVWVALTLQLGSFDSQYATWSDLAKPKSQHHAFNWHDLTLPSWSGTLALILLIGPKVMGAALILSRPAERARFGGAGKLLAGLLVEVLISALMAPVLALTQTRFMGEILMGRDSGWKSQQRDGDGVGFKTAVARYWWVTAIGLGLTAAASPWPPLLLASSPLLIGTLLIVPFAMFSSRKTVGKWATAGGLMATPEELFPAPVLERRAVWPVAPVYAPVEAAAAVVPVVVPVQTEEAVSA